MTHVFYGKLEIRGYEIIMIFFTSDLHFCHVKIIPMCNRPFADINEMHKVLIANWNAAVGKDDEVYILGDFLYKGQGQQANRILCQLNGKKYLVKGDHERYLEDPDFDHSHYEWIKDYYELPYKDTRFILFHFPILEWAHYWRKSVHLHGHNHCAIEPISGYWGKRTFNVCIDLNNFTPISADAIYESVFGNNDN